MYLYGNLIDDLIPGLMCLVDHIDETVNAMEIKLLEVSEANFGSRKKWKISEAAS